tara:strand:+ start:317 stop:1069 length:753 start_codon:yes stop_codon:yes gene_type:complete
MGKFKKHSKDKSSKRKEKQKGGEREIREKFTEGRQHRAPPIEPKTDNQKRYMQVLRTERLIVVRGSAGTGKSFLSSALAGDALLRGDINKVIVCRPNVAMGESIGHRKGSDWDKLYPFVRPMLDTLKKRMGGGSYDVAIASKQIEIQALDAIRGMSFDGNVVILCDEMSNSTPAEIRSVVTRLGEKAQMVVMGDPKQTDIRGENGLDYICDMINKYKIPDTAIIEFTAADIVRSGIARAFVMAFDKEASQ